jgi:pimeloyl-ACP methyl ester carboxylesterase
MADVSTAGKPAASRDHLVILVHGINTLALWMGEVKPALEKAGLAVGSTSYGKFGVPRFLSPFRWMRREAIRRVVSDIKTAKRSHRLTTGSEPRYTSLIAHSFGTYVVGKILTDHPEFKWHRLIFCGSVVRDDFPFDKVEVLERFEHPLLNEVGTKDYYPALAQSAGWGYGSVGSTGFNRPPVKTRWHKGFRHSDFLTETFCNTFWVPFLQGHDPKDADRPSKLPVWIRGITLLPLRWMVLGVVAFAAVTVIRSVLESLPDCSFCTSTVASDPIIRKVTAGNPCDNDVGPGPVCLTPSSTFYTLNPKSIRFVPILTTELGIYNNGDITKYRASHTGWYVDDRVEVSQRKICVIVYARTPACEHKFALTGRVEVDETLNLWPWR